MIKLPILAIKDCEWKDNGIIKKYFRLTIALPDGDTAKINFYHEVTGTQVVMQPVVNKEGYITLRTVGIE